MDICIYNISRRSLLRFSCKLVSISQLKAATRITPRVCFCLPALSRLYEMQEKPNDPLAYIAERLQQCLESGKVSDYR